MSDGYCDVKFCRKRKTIEYQWAELRAQLCDEHNEQYCDMPGGDAIGNMRALLAGAEPERIKEQPAGKAQSLLSFFTGSDSEKMRTSVPQNR
jgi:hypothetical protein